MYLTQGGGGGGGVKSGSSLKDSLHENVPPKKKTERNKHYKQCFIKRLQGNIETKGKNQSFSALNGRPLHDQVQVWAEQLSSPPAKLIPRLCLAKHMILSLLSVVYSATGSLTVTDPCPQQETCHKTTSFLDKENWMFVSSCWFCCHSFHRFLKWSSKPQQKMCITM